MVLSVYKHSTWWRSSPAPEGLARPDGLDANLGSQRPCLRSWTEPAHTPKGISATDSRTKRQELCTAQYPCTGTGTGTSLYEVPIGSTPHLPGIEFDSSAFPAQGQPVPGHVALQGISKTKKSTEFFGT